MTPKRQHGVSNVNGLCWINFGEESGKLHVKNPSEK